MPSKFCVVLLLVYLSRGCTFPRDAPAFSLMGAIQHGESWRASRENRRIISNPDTISSSGALHHRQEYHSEKSATDNGEIEVDNPEKQIFMLTLTLSPPTNVAESPELSDFGHLLAPRPNSSSPGSLNDTTGYIKTPENQRTERVSKNQVAGEIYYKNTAPGGVKRRLPGPKHAKGPGPLPHGELPGDVCDRCPVNAQGISRLLPCTCVGNTGTQAGKISITCPNTIHNTEELRGILTENKDYITTHVFRFTLQNSQVDGVISQALWGELDFVQVLLENNKFDWVDNKAFANSNGTLHYLSLKNNSLKQFTTSSANELPYLTTLDLSYNNLSVVFTDAFTYKGLEYLDLSYNQINSIGKRSFAELDCLTELNLSKNQLTKLDDETFKFNSHSQLSDLLLIDISDNEITSIAKTAFAGLFWVQINLQNNQLRTVSEEAFNHVLVDSSYFAVISLMGNPINCDCKVLWIVNSTQVQSSFDNFMCINLGKPIRETTVEDLGNCTKNKMEEPAAASTTPLYEVPLG